MNVIGNNHRIGVYDGKVAGLYDLEETLGSGHFAVVKLARHVFTGEKVAVKVIDKTKLDEVSKAHLFQEVRCMKLVQHPNVVRLYEVIDTQTKLYLILELGDGGDLYDYIMKHEGGLTEKLAKDYFRQIVRAISYCHQLHVVHRDLKPENVVFFEKLGVVKLTDFGFSNKFCPGQKLETSCGSLAYSAPEILLGDSYDAPAVDVWSLGVILYMLVCGHPPFQEANDSETLTMIMDCKYTIPPHISDECKDLISKMLVVAPDKRWTLHQIAQNSWLAQDGPETVVPEYLPLVSRQQVSDDDHALIIQKMVNGNIATKDEIIDALDKNEYNHITATYFLLAERKLRAHRQEQAQKRKPDLTLSVSNASRLSPKSRTQCLKEEHKKAQDGNSDFLLPANVGHLCVPRTPGVEGSQSGRIRKCSIVQEEEDDEDDGDDDESITLNRRGSRSEGRINVTIQDRIAAEADRLKKEAAAAAASMSIQSRGSIGNCEPDNREREHETELTLTDIGVPIQSNERSNSCDHGRPTVDSNKADDLASTIFLTDSATISIPIPSQTSSQVSSIPKYKTMPSPTRANTILTGASCLNEIFEEGTDVGSSDSATTTPRPVTRHAHYINNRTHSQGSSAHRRSKFHKTRTASCSSSDASDDDSENRKKRAHKIVDTTKPLQAQRRDSHDDSSDSQDPGNSATSGSVSTSTYLIVSDEKLSPEEAKNNGRQNNENNSNGRQKTGQQVGFRRHRTGRRRAGETRLRESQSLNRITEVQESEMPIANLAAHTATATPLTNHHHVTQKPKGFSARLFHGFRKNDTTATTAEVPRIPTQTAGTDEMEVVLGVELAKALKVTESKSSSATKKLKMLGRYFQVHKKLCIPLPGIFQRGRLYKAQSCSSIVRDKVNQQITNTTTARHSALFSDKTRILKNCLGARLLGSDGDINQNSGKSAIVFSMTSTSNNIPKSTPSVVTHNRHRIIDTSLCSSKC